MKKIECVYQSLPNECGACCVLMILEAYNCHVPLYYLRRELGVGKNGVYMSSMQTFLEKYGFKVKIYQCNMQGACVLGGPSIIGWSNNHFVVFLEKKQSFVHIIDPAVGYLKVTEQEFNEKFTGFLLYPSKEKKVNKRKKYKNCQLDRNIVKVIGLEMFTFIYSFMQPYFIQMIVDSLEYEKSIYVYVLFAIIFMLFLSSVCEYWKIKVCNRSYVEMSTNIIKNTLNMPYNIIQNYTSGNLIFKLNCLPVYKDVYYKHIPNLICNSILCILPFIGIYVYSKKMTVFLALPTVLFCGMVGVLIKSMVELTNKSIKAESELTSIVDEYINAMREIKLNAMESECEEKWNEKFQKSNDFQVKIEVIQNIYNLITEIAFIVIPLLVLIFAIYFEKMTLGKAMACYSMSTIVFRSVSALFTDGYSWLNGKKHLKNLQELQEIFQCYKKQEAESKNKKISGKINIQLKNLSFRYAKYERNTIFDINMDIQYGNYVAIVGKSGAGKSTLLKLLLGMYDDYEGEIKINDIEMRKINKKDFYSKVGVVSQDFLLLNKSVADNIRMDNEKISYDEIQEICRVLQLHEEIEKLTMGYDTIVQGDNFSGGQRQRIAIARALINKPEVVVLDEATNFLNIEVEKKIMEYLKKVGCTIIFVTHHIEMVKDADYVMILDKGESVYQGKYNTLCEKNMYSRFKE